MGTWGIMNFENDDAMDWIGELTQSRGTKVIEQAFDAVLKPAASEYLEAPACCCALAAAEVVAAARGNPSTDLPEEVAQWIQSQLGQTPDGLLDRGRRAVERISSASELRNLWEEVPELDGWQENIKNLQARLV